MSVTASAVRASAALLALAAMRDALIAAAASVARV
jgi:hypothetical protein